MNEEELNLKQMQKEWHGSKKSYLLGFFFSLICTTIAYFFVYQEIFPPTILFYTILGFALLQAVVQLFFFLHIGSETNPRWHTLLFLLMVLVLLIVILGSFWIMHDLDQRAMSDMGGMLHD